MSENRKNEYPLHEEIIEGNLENCTKLIESGTIDINKQDEQGYSPLHAASQRKLVSVVQKLIEYGALVNIQDSWGNTPLVRALGNSEENATIINLLLKAGTDPNIKNNHGNSVITHVSKLKTHPNNDLFKMFF